VIRLSAFVVQSAIKHLAILGARLFGTSVQALVATVVAQILLKLFDLLARVVRLVAQYWTWSIPSTDIHIMLKLYAIQQQPNKQQPNKQQPNNTVSV
jgi:hypothetical protein